MVLDEKNSGIVGVVVIVIGANVLLVGRRILMLQTSQPSIS